MSDSEDFLFRINTEELYPQEEISEHSPKRKKAKLSSKNKRKKRKMNKKISPNHFIGFQIYDAVIHQRIANFQSKIIEKNPRLKKALIDLRTLHITMAVTHLENAKRVRELQEKLSDWGEKEMKSHFAKPIHLTFEGIGLFESGVAYVKIKECENHKRLCKLASAMNYLLCNSGFYAEKRKEYIPHLTLLKLSRNYKLFKDKKTFKNDFEVFSQCEDYFGSQDIKDIQLLSLTEPKEDNGYYKCLWERATSELP